MASAAEILAQLESQRAETNRLMQPAWPGIFGQIGRRQLKETALARSMDRESVVADVGGNIAELQAAGVNTNAIPGIGEALELGGQDVVNQLLQNPLTPLSTTLSGMRDRSVAQGVAAQQIATREAEAKARSAEAKATQDQFAAGMLDVESALLEREKAKAENRQFIREQMAHEQGIALPEHGKQAALVHPLTGQEVIAELPGTPEYIERYNRMRGAIDALSLTNRIVTDINAAGISGTDLIGPRASRVDANRSQLFSRIFQSRGMGAPQGPDIELLERGLPDTTSISANLRGMLTGGAGGQKSSALQGYQSVQEEMQQTITNELLANPYLIDSLTDYDIGQLHPDSDLAKLIRQLRGQ